MSKELTSLLNQIKDEKNNNLKPEYLLDTVTCMGIKGTIVDNGELNFTASDNTYEIPAGYTSGGQVKPADITGLTDYKICTSLAYDIAGQVVNPTNGLVLYLDAKQNAENGYVPDTNTWYNKADNGATYAVKASGETSWSEIDGLVCTGGCWNSPELNMFEGTYELYCKITEFTPIDNMWFGNQSNVIGAMISGGDYEAGNWGLAIRCL